MANKLFTIYILEDDGVTIKDTIILHGTVSVEPTFTSEVVDYPVEEGFNISDNVYRRPTTVKAEVFLFDRINVESRSTQILPGGTRLTTVHGWQRGETREQQLEKLVAAHNKASLCRLVSSNVVLGTCVLSQLIPIVNDESSNTFKTSIQFQEINIAKLETAIFQQVIDGDTVVSVKPSDNGTASRLITERILEVEETTEKSKLEKFHDWAKGRLGQPFLINPILA